MGKVAHMVIHFMDGSKIVFEYDKLDGREDASIASKVKKALEHDKIVVQTYDSMIVIPVANVKYIQVTPAPDALPEGILKNAEIIE
ncbi:MAG: hypothetical protein ACOZF0_07475 [Thermodesulfobacteriota bacterium]